MSIKPTLLPNKDISVSEFMEFQLPLEAASKFTDSRDYFSSNPATADA
jgi:hypothetical protein